MGSDKLNHTEERTYIFKMCNVFILGQVLTGIELCLYVVSIILTFIYGKSIYGVIISIFIAIVCLILEFIGLTKKHFGLSIFSIVFRCVQFGLSIIGAVYLALLFVYSFGFDFVDLDFDFDFGGALFAIWIACIINIVYAAFRIALQSLVFHKIKKENEQTLPSITPKLQDGKFNANVGNPYNQDPIQMNYMAYQPQGYVNQGITPEYQNPPPYQNQKA